MSKSIKDKTSQSNQPDTSNVFFRLRQEHNNKVGFDEKELSQTDLAREMSKDRSHVTRLEKDPSKATIDDLKFYHERFGVSYDYLMGANISKNPKNQRISKDLGLTDEAIETIININRSGKGDNAASSNELNRILNVVIGNGKDTVAFLQSIIDYLVKEEDITPTGDPILDDIYSTVSRAQLMNSILVFINRVKPQVRDLIKNRLVDIQNYNELSEDEKHPVSLNLAEDTSTVYSARRVEEK